MSLAFAALLMAGWSPIIATRVDLSAFGSPVDLRSWDGPKPVIAPAADPVVRRPLVYRQFVPLAAPCSTGRCPRR